MALDGLFGGMSAKEFLAKHWQKKPLLVRGALPNFRDPLTVDELAGLATEEGVKARLVMERGGPTPWHLEHGPFTARRLGRLPRSHWTLLVSDVNQYVDDAALLLDRFSFIPHWRMDDLMVSCAPPFGTVGAHVDSYDVFLIQGMGRRRWQIAEQYDDQWRAGVPLKILRNFRAEAEWILGPGDMLYLPPGVAHFGVALDNCLTYSVGFRAPDPAALRRDLFNISDELLAGVGRNELYADRRLVPAQRPGKVSAEALSAVTEMMREPLAQPDVVARWFGAWTTRPPTGAQPLPRLRRPTAAGLAKRLQRDDVVLRTDLLRVAYVELSTGDTAFFAGGEEWLLPAACVELVENLCASRRIPTRSLRTALPKPAAKRAVALAFLADLAARGVLDLTISQGRGKR